MSDFNPNLKQTPLEVKKEFNVDFIMTNVQEIQEITG